MQSISERRRQALLQRRREENDAYGRDPNWVMNRDIAGRRASEAGRQAVINQLLEVLEPSPDPSLLDVGCGRGEITEHLQPHFWQVTGTDLAPGMLESARRVLGDAPLHVCAADGLPFADGSFSRALCYAVFMHFPDLAYARRAFREILRVVERGGIAVIGDVADASRKKLSFEWHLWQTMPLLKRASEQVRRACTDLVCGRRPYGFYPLSFFEKLAAEDGHTRCIVSQPAELYRAAWRVNVVIRKAVLLVVGKAALARITWELSELAEWPLVPEAISL